MSKFGELVNPEGLVNLVVTDLDLSDQAPRVEVDPEYVNPEAGDANETWHDPFPVGDEETVPATQKKIFEINEANPDRETPISDTKDQ
jgi:hypothetical protein